MRRVLIVFCVFACFTILGPRTYSAPADTARPVSTHIVTNQKTGTIRFIVDGKVVAQIDRKGLHVVDRIDYGGTLTDAGSAYVKKAIAEDDKDAP
jgi:hypothetical protein